MVNPDGEDIGFCFINSQHATVQKKFEDYIDSFKYCI